MTYQLKVLNLTMILILSASLSYGQLDSTKIKKNDTNSQVELTYFYAGPFCPYCNIDHPETKFGFKIKCVGCMILTEELANNLEVSEILDKKYGKGWTEKYIAKYGNCEKQ